MAGEPQRSLVLFMNKLFLLSGNGHFLTCMLHPTFSTPTCIFYSSCYFLHALNFKSPFLSYGCHLFHDKLELSEKAIFFQHRKAAAVSFIFPCSLYSGPSTGGGNLLSVENIHSCLLTGSYSNTNHQFVYLSNAQIKT